VSAVELRALLVGKAVPINDKGDLSAIGKCPVATALWLGEEGFVGDEQADRRVHGGPEKAVHHYPFEHYASWLADHADLSLPLAEVGAFGENLSTVGMTEETVCVGDVYRLGGALVQVSQARQPCWKLAERFGRRDMPLRLQQTGRTGWYYRVLQPGEVRVGYTLMLVERPHPDWPLARLLRVIFDRSLASEVLKDIVALTVLSASWRKLAEKRLASREVEGWDRRLYRDPA
jgi:MOSC domain-containing protein YiiM